VVIGSTSGSLLWLLVILTLILVGLGVVIAAIIHAATTPHQDFQAAHQSKAAWISAMAILGLVLWPVGIVVALIYLLAIRPKLDLVRQGRSQ
jgi:uncharacterized membrane protein